MDGDKLVLFAVEKLMKCFGAWSGCQTVNGTFSSSLMSDISMESIFQKIF